MKNLKWNKMKYLLLGVFSIVIISNTKAQSTHAGPGNPYAPGRYLGFGNNFGAPILFGSNGVERMMLNGNVFNSVNGGATLNRQGFLGVGTPNGFFPAFGGIGPYSLLHLNGVNASGTPQQGGYRNWMQYGITSTHNQDLMFIGQRATGGTDITDAVIGWSDNSSNSSPGPDNMVFNFLAGGTDDLSGGGNFGREVMRLTAIGNIGIGPRFSNAAQPQSQLHINGENTVPAYLMITNQSFTGQTFNDGFHFGITGAGIAEINQKENADMRFFTSNTQRAVIKNTGSVGIGTNTPGNRLEINSQLTGSSGLRFTNMTSTNTPQVNPGNGVLSVNLAGDVIYVPGNGIASADNGISMNAGLIQLGVPCTLTGGAINWAGIISNRLTTDRVISNNNQSFWIASLNTETGGVGIGGQNASVPFCGTGNTFEVSANAKNIKYGNTGASGIRLTKLTSTSATIPNGTNGVNSARVLTVDGDGDIVLTNAVAGNSNFGGLCISPLTLTNLPANWRVGMNGFSVNFQGTGNVNIGDIQTCIPGSSGPARLWLRNSFGPPSPNTGFRIDQGNGQYAAEIMGNVFIQGSLTAGSLIVPSDRNIKENVVSLNSPLDILAKLKPVSYNLKSKALPQLNVDVSKTYGLIAQDVENIIPGLVKDLVIPAGYDPAGVITHPSLKLKSLNYIGLIPFLIGGVQELNDKQNSMQTALDKIGSQERLIQEQQSIMDSLKSSLAKQNAINIDVQQQLASLLNKLNTCCSNTAPKKLK